MPAPKRVLALVTSVLLALPLLAACGGDDGPKVVVYNAQHEELIQEVAKAFEEKTDIDVELRKGKDLELANQLVAEGDASPADVFLTENSPAMRLVDEAGLFTELDEQTLANIPAQYQPENGSWTGFAARTTALVYNTDAVDQAELPTSILELGEPQWKGRVTFDPTGADFQAIVAAVLAVEGEEVTRQWLEGLKENSEFSSNNLVVMKAVNDGQHDIGIFYHYYWYRDQEESKENSANTGLHILGNQDAGAFLSTSGAGVLAAGDNPEEAQQFVQYLTSEEGQQVIADSYALEYTLNPAVPLERGNVKPLSELEPPQVSPDDLDSEKVIELMQGAGLL